jgi:hypothetical protein
MTLATRADIFACLLLAFPAPQFFHIVWNARNFLHFVLLHDDRV